MPIAGRRAIAAPTCRAILCDLSLSLGRIVENWTGGIDEGAALGENRAQSVEVGLSLNGVFGRRTGFE